MKVTVLGDASDATLTQWTIDLLMDDTHPNARLDEFGFNLVNGSSAGEQYWLEDISLDYAGTSWDKLQGYGAGNARFLLTLDHAGGNSGNATNGNSLTFFLRKSGAFTIGDFLDAPGICSNDSLGCNQMAAHVQGLTDGAGGIAVGAYEGGVPDVTPVPEPSSLILLGTGAVAAAFARRRRRKTEEQQR